MDREFDWDPIKAEQNLLKHGISFLEAIQVFADIQAVIEPDTRFDYGEERFLRVGRIADGRLVGVIYTERTGKYRLISARRASRRERREYGSRPAT